MVDELEALISPTNPNLPEGQERQVWLQGVFYACIGVAGARGSRTHRPDRRAAANGFEVRSRLSRPLPPLTPASLVIGIDGEFASLAVVPFASLS